MKETPPELRGVDYWVKVPPSLRDSQWKEGLLQSHQLTSQQTYDFRGTLRGGEWIGVHDDDDVAVA